MTNGLLSALCCTRPRKESTGEQSAARSDSRGVNPVRAEPGGGVETPSLARGLGAVAARGRLPWSRRRCTRSMRRPEQRRPRPSTRSRRSRLGDPGGPPEEDLGGGASVTGGMSSMIETVAGTPTTGCPPRPSCCMTSATTSSTTSRRLRLRSWRVGWRSSSSRTRSTESSVARAEGEAGRSRSRARAAVGVEAEAVRGLPAPSCTCVAGPHGARAAGRGADRRGDAGRTRPRRRLRVPDQRSEVDRLAQRLVRGRARVPAYRGRGRSAWCWPRQQAL